MIRLSIIDDDEIILDNVGDWLTRHAAAITVVSTARTVDEFLGQPRLSATIVLLDLLLRDGHDSADNVSRLVAAGFTVVACSSRDDPVRIRRVIDAGAHSYVRKAKDPTELRTALEAADNGTPYTSPVHSGVLESAHGPGAADLSGQERQALRLYASGLTIPQVARRMHVEPSTVKGYIDRVRRKYDDLGRVAHTKIDLRRRAEEDGWLDPSSDTTTSTRHAAS